MSSQGLFVFLKEVHSQQKLGQDCLCKPATEVLLRTPASGRLQLCDWGHDCTHSKTTEQVGKVQGLQNPSWWKKKTKCHIDSHLGDFRNTCSSTKHSNHFLLLRNLIFLKVLSFFLHTNACNVNKMFWNISEKSCFRHNLKMIYWKWLYYEASNFHLYCWHDHFQMGILITEDDEDPPDHFSDLTSTS